MPDQHHCKDCGQPVKWVRTFSGARLPFLPSPDGQGSYRFHQVYDFATGKKELRAYPLTKNQRAEAQSRGEALWLPHNAVCTALPAPGSGRCPAHLREKLGLKKIEDNQ